MLPFTALGQREPAASAAAAGVVPIVAVQGHNRLVVERLPTIERPAYGMGQAARLLGVRRDTLRRWVDGYERKGVHYEPVIRAQRTGDDLVTWGEFVEAGYLYEYRKRRVSLQRLRPVVQRLREELGVRYPLATARPYLYGQDLVMRLQTELDLERELWMVLSQREQLILAPPASEFFEKVEFGADGNASVYLPDGPQSPVRVDPDHAFGEPAVFNVRTENLYELFLAGEDVEQIADGYDLDSRSVQAAVRYEQRRAEFRAA